MLLLGHRGVSDPFYSGATMPLPKQTIGRLGATSSFEAATIRLLAGCADVVERSGATLVAQRTNLMVLGTASVRVQTEGGVRQLLRRMDLDWRAVDSHLRRNLRHQRYFKQVAFELIEYFVRTKQGEHTLAFLHSYRLLERISFVFPLLYAVRSDEYTGAFAALREYFKGGVESELALLRKFQDQSIDSADRQAPSHFDFSNLDRDFSRPSFEVVKRCTPASEIASDTYPTLSFSSGALLSLMINLRNRYFHFSSSNETNISLDEIGNSDDFFGLLNGSFINWLGVIFLASLTARIR